MVDPMFEQNMRAKIVEVIDKYAPENTVFGGWDDAENHGGMCGRFKIPGTYSYRNKIVISFPYARNYSWDWVRKIVLHEIAHAKLPTEGHTPMFREVCESLGGIRSCDDLPYGLKPRFEGTCPVCGKKQLEYSRKPSLYHKHDGEEVHFDWKYIGEVRIIDSIETLRENIGLIHVCINKEKGIRESLEIDPEIDIAEWSRKLIRKDGVNLKLKKNSYRCTLGDEENEITIDTMSYTVVSARKKTSKTSGK